MEEEYICCICGKRFKGYGNNPDPVKEEGRCCDECNIKVVIPAREEQIRQIIDSWWMRHHIMGMLEDDWKCHLFNNLLNMMW